MLPSACALRCCLPLADGDSVHLVEINPKLFPICLPNSPSTGSTALPSPRTTATQLCGHRRKQRGRGITRTRRKHLQAAAGGTQTRLRVAAACCGPNPLTLDPCTESSQMPALTSVQPPAAPVRANVAGTRSGALGMSLSLPDRGAGRSRQDCASPSVASALSLLIFLFFFPPCLLWVYYCHYFNYSARSSWLCQGQPMGSSSFIHLLGCPM